MPNPMGPTAFNVDTTGFRAEPESDFRGVLISLLGSVFSVRSGSTARREALDDFHDAIAPYEDKAFEEAIAAIQAKKTAWTDEGTWERHYQRALLRALRSLMYRTGFDGDLSASDYQEDL